MSKSVLRSESHFCLEAFVLGVWHYCIMHIPDNTVGASSYYTFYPSAKEGGTGRRHPFVSCIGNNPSRFIELEPCARYLGVAQEFADLTHKAPVPDGYYSPYFHSVTIDISAVKTILFEETINFRDFYVCNGIHRRFFRQSDMCDGKLPRMTDDNPTIESVKEFGLRMLIQLEPGLFKKVTGLDVKDFELLCTIGVFNASNLMYAYRRYLILKLA